MPSAHRITPADIEALISDEAYYVFPGTTVTVCCLTLLNGYNVVAEAACVSPENFDAEVGMTISRANAKDKIWSLAGYALRESLVAESNPGFASLTEEERALWRQGLPVKYR